MSKKSTFDAARGGNTAASVESDADHLIEQPPGTTGTEPQGIGSNANVLRTVEAPIALHQINHSREIKVKNDVEVSWHVVP
jgi:hypothetical protein